MSKSLNGSKTHQNLKDAFAGESQAIAATAFGAPLYLHRGIEALLRGGAERRARKGVSGFAERARANERDRMAYLRCLAMLSEFEGDTQRALDRLRGAESLAEGVGLPGELWQIQGKIGELHERRRQTEEARAGFSRAAQTLRMLAGKIGDEELREGFLSAPRVRRALAHDALAHDD